MAFGGSNPNAEGGRRCPRSAIFDRIMTSRSPDDWREFDPILAANLATTTVELDKLLAIVAKAGWVVQAGRNGTQFARSPLLDPIQHLTTRQLSLARALGITGAPADAVTIEKNAKTANKASGTVAENDDIASLLAQPTGRN